ncbi:hypothetical protein QVD17_10647 [Tagetes erecta]|uniref:Uncharacterized protein n=1 Tax=Tagetes erecta TaxID=13708 RepID=A0AAD8L2U5_TARER|nr:hypothetical protein QVD17_10647 [Tagetes erecta]
MKEADKYYDERNVATQDQSDQAATQCHQDCERKGPKSESRCDLKLKVVLLLILSLYINGHNSSRSPTEEKKNSIFNLYS